MRERWSNASIVLHWLSAALIIGLATAGFVMTDLSAGSGGRLLLSRAHTLGGATLMALALARLIVRRRSSPIAPLPLSDLHRRGVGAIHALLYFVTFGIGLSGLATGATSAWPEYLRGALAEAPELKSLASREVHEVLVFALFGLVALHVGGVVLQQFRQGGIVRRMVPFIE